MRTNIITLVLGLLAIVLLGIHFGIQPWSPTRIAGLMIGLPSLALLVLARIELGGSFSVRPKAQTLVTHGLYSRPPRKMSGNPTIRPFDRLGFSSTCADPSRRKDWPLDRRIR